MEEDTTPQNLPAVCKSCYGARDGCCATCAEVREAYRQKVTKK